jgi:hypothetical protein
MPGGLAIGASNVASPCVPLALDECTPLAHTACTPLAHTACAPTPVPDEFPGPPRVGRSAPPADEMDRASLAIERCQALLSRRGEVSGPGLAVGIRSFTDSRIRSARLQTGWLWHPFQYRRLGIR